jgi:hypothetical protein
MTISVRLSPRDRPHASRIAFHLTGAPTRFGITAKFYDASSVLDNEIGAAIFRGFLGPALAEHRFRPAPPARVVGCGLEAVQIAFDVQRQAVSAAKVVVALT